jgi:hypothetical protein
MRQRRVAIRVGEAGIRVHSDVTPVRKATVFFSALAVIGCLGMAYGIVRAELAIGVLGAFGLPISVRLVGRGFASEREGIADAAPRSSRGTTRWYAWWLLPVGFVVLFVLNLPATADISGAVVAGAEAAGLAAGTAGGACVGCAYRGGGCEGGDRGERDGDAVVVMAASWACVVRCHAISGGRQRAAISRLTGRHLGA